jgi:CHAD domain-containing protein
MEMEAKYTILGPLHPASITDLNLSPFQLHPEGEAYHQDVLLDTTNKTITSSGHSLRLRHKLGNTVATFKGPNHGSAGVRVREEIEVPIAAEAADDYHQWPAEVRKRILPLVKDEPLVPLIKMHVHRVTWAVLRDGKTVGELALDQGIISAGGRTARVHEIEVEIKDTGTRKDLTAFGHVLSDRLPLQPQPRGKLQRGLALLRQHRGLDGHLPLTSVGRHAVHRHLRKLRKSEPIARDGADPEGVHTMRTATRRLRTTLRILEESPDFDRKLLATLRKGLKRLARVLGDVRDLDVFLERVDDFAGEHPEQHDGLGVLRKELRTRRETARAELMGFLESHRLRHLLDELEAFAVGRIAMPQRERPQLVRHFAGSAIWGRYEEVLNFETALADAPPVTLHALRIACKRLRYTLELFEGELGKGTQPLVKALVKVQDHLGALQDAVVELALVNELRERAPEDTGLATYAKALEEQRDRMRRGFPALWQDLSDPGFTQELAELIAGL